MKRSQLWIWIALVVVSVGILTAGGIAVARTGDPAGRWFVAVAVIVFWLVLVGPSFGALLFLRANQRRTERAGLDKPPESGVRFLSAMDVRLAKQLDVKRPVKLGLGWWLGFPIRTVVVNSAGGIEVWDRAGRLLQTIPWSQIGRVSYSTRVVRGLRRSSIEVWLKDGSPNRVILLPISRQDFDFGHRTAEELDTLRQDAAG